MGRVLRDWRAIHFYAASRALSRCGDTETSLRATDFDKLVKRGWLARNEKGNLFVTSVPAEHFAPFNLEFVNRVLELADRLRAVLADAQAEKR